MHQLLITTPAAHLMLPAPVVTHEQYVQSVYRLACKRANPSTRQHLEAIKLVYGAGPSGVRGVTYFSRWKNGHDEAYPFVEICAFAERDWLQIAGTVLHELGHVMAGPGAGHGIDWRASCLALGLQNFEAAGTDYQENTFQPDMFAAVWELPRPNDGEPSDTAARAGAPGAGLFTNLRPCTAGLGTRGGKSRGAGSGSRSIKVSCPECGYTARITRKWLDVGPPSCGAGHGPLSE